jgi:steroid delta-isomerase-like uncharacterized protein
VQKNIFRKSQNSVSDFFLREKFNKLYIPKNFALNLQKKEAVMNNNDVSKLNDAVLDAWNRHDVKKFLTFVDENIVWQDTASPEPIRGKEGAEQFFNGWSTAFPDFKITPLSTVVSGDNIAVEIEFRGTNTGPLRMGDQPEISATNKKVSNRGCYFGKVKNGKFTQVHSYPDLAGMMVQLGLQEMHEAHA